MKKKVKSLQEIAPKEYVSDPKEQVLSAAVRDFLLCSPEAVGRKMLQQVVSPSIYHLIPHGGAMDVGIMKSVINFAALVKLAEISVKSAANRMTEQGTFYEPIRCYLEQLPVREILENADSGMMEFICDCFLAVSQN